MQTVQQQVALANMQELLVKVSQIKIDPNKLMLDHPPLIKNRILNFLSPLGDRQVLQEMHHISWLKYGKQ